MFFQVGLSNAQIFLTTALVVLLYFSIWGVVAIQKKRGDLADIAWGLGFFLVSWTAFSLSAFSFKSLLVNLMITAWGLRLSTHIFFRNRKRGEDFRYEELKKGWGGNVSLRMFFQVFMLQGVLLYIVALPILWVNTHPQLVQGNVLWFSSVVWLVGFVIETIGDHQLSSFRKLSSNRGQLLTTGLWSYVRHPNYLGEIVQWWAIWMVSENLYLLISPILITLLIVKVSGIAPLEEKMKKHPDFADYAQKTPSLIPLPLVNGAIYSFAWFMIIRLGSEGSFLYPFGIFLLAYGLQIVLFSKWDRKSLLVAPILSVYSLFLGLLQEMMFIGFDLLQYPNESFLPPLWLRSLYPLFALTLNSSLRFINRSLILAFIFGGLGALSSYIFGEQMGGVVISSTFFYPVCFVSWGINLTILVLLNRKMNFLREKYTNPTSNQSVLTVFFDDQCPVCSVEMQKLKKRRQTGKIDYANLGSEEEFKSKKVAISYECAMKSIHAIDGEGNVFIGTEALSQLYARTDLPFVAVLLQAPGFRSIFNLGYFVWAKIRRSLPRG